MNRMKIGTKEFRTSGHTYVMGILNVTPDSFSDGGKWNERDRALTLEENPLVPGIRLFRNRKRSKERRL